MDQAEADPRSSTSDQIDEEAVLQQQTDEEENLLQQSDNEDEVFEQSIEDEVFEQSIEEEVLAADLDQQENCCGAATSSIAELSDCECCKEDEAFQPKDKTILSLSRVHNQEYRTLNAIM